MFEPRTTVDVDGNAGGGWRLPARIQSGETAQPAGLREPGGFCGAELSIPSSGRAAPSLRRGWTRNKQKHKLNHVPGLTHGLAQKSEPGQSMMQLLYGARLCWQIRIWECAEGYVTVRPTWFITLGPDSTREDAEKEADRVRKMYRNWEETRSIAQYFRMAESRVCLPPKKPVLVAGEMPSAKLREEIHIYEIQKEERAARYRVLKTVFPKTAELTEQAELTDDPKIKSRLELESVEAYFAENAPAWPSLVFKAWQKCNQIGLQWMNWLYVWNNNREKRPRDVNPIDYELAFNWFWKGYFLMTAEQLSGVMSKQNLQSIIRPIRTSNS
jgi:hypothetical protein